MNHPTNYQSEFQILENWAADVLKQFPGIQVNPPAERIVHFGCIPAMKWNLTCDPGIKPKDVITCILIMGKKYAKDYRYWFVFDKTAGIMILQFYPYHKNSNGRSISRSRS